MGDLTPKTKKAEVLIDEEPQTSRVAVESG
jgi:hypothetical protein